MRNIYVETNLYVFFRAFRQLMFARAYHNSEIKNTNILRKNNKNCFNFRATEFDFGMKKIVNHRPFMIWNSNSILLCNPRKNFFKRNFCTINNFELGSKFLKETFEYKNKNISSWIIESKVRKLCKFYNEFLKTHKDDFIQTLAENYGLSHKKVFELSQLLAKYSTLSENAIKFDIKILKIEDQLRNFLTPEYSWLFLHIAKLENGVKFLVDLRSDVLELIAKKTSLSVNTVELQQLNLTLREILSLWFSVGFLELQRITWKSSCELLQKISEYEAVHPIKSWTDLKRRVGLHRRCFVFLHRSMPGEPIVVLHTALCDKIVSSVNEIFTVESTISENYMVSNNEDLLKPDEEDPKNIKAAMFYSISSTQKGLRGIELGNYLIKCVVQELQTEFPQMTQFASLSPIPTFRKWLIEKIKSIEKGSSDIFFLDEIKHLNKFFGKFDFWKEFRELLLTNAWINNQELASFMEKPLMRLCARYLFLEKHRGYAFDKVANFHLRNGAVLWRLNWCADLSPRGLGNSCGIMVNYRYFLDEAESNSKAYLENFYISASDQVLNLSNEAHQLMCAFKD